MNLIQIRQIQIADLKVIADLLLQLGYSATPEQLQKYLGKSDSLRLPLPCEGKRPKPTMRP